MGHRINAVSLFILIMSGLQILNAHPALYWGNRSDQNVAPLSIRPVRTDSGDIKGITTVLGRSFETTGVLGAIPITWRERSRHGRTTPGSRWLAMGRQWHLIFAWIFVVTGLLYLTYAVFIRHLLQHLADAVRSTPHWPRDMPTWPKAISPIGV